MKIKLTAHIKQHAGDVLLECQDSFDYNLENLSFSVSDGVSQAYRPELWSRILTKAYVTSPDTFFVQNNEGQFIINQQLGLSLQWASAEQNAYKNASPQEQFILDMKKNSINIGAATFIGVKLTNEGINYYTIGDSVLFFFDCETQTLTAYSSMMPESGEMIFNNSPEYIDTNECNHGRVISGVIPYRKGILFMATDALSDWIVERRASAKVVETILRDMMSIPTHEDYDKFVDCARNDENPTKLKDDDTTFVALEFIDIDEEKPIIEHNYAEKFDKLYTSNLIYELNNAKNETEAERSARSRYELALKNKERQLDKSIKDLESANKDLESLQSNVQKLNATIQKLQGELSAAQTTKSSLQSSVQALNSENQRLKSENKHLKNENQRLKTENQQLKKTSNPTIDEKTIANLQSQLNASQASLLQAMNKIKEYESSIQKLKGSSLLQPIDFTTFSPFMGELEITGVQVTTIQVGTPTKDGGYQI